METSTTEIADGIFRFSTFVSGKNIRFNQYAIRAGEPLLFHCGLRGLFRQVLATVSRVMPPESIRWVSYGHHEADESGSMNEWLDAAPHAQVAVGRIACMLSANDLARRAPRALADEEVMELGGKRVRFLTTPHVPHGWDAGLVYEETTATLLCGDLFTRTGDCEDVTEGDLVGPALEAETLYGATALTPATASTIRRLAALAPATLGLMHGPAFHGDGAAALLELARGYEARLESAWAGIVK